MTTSQQFRSYTVDNLIANLSRASHPVESHNVPSQAIFIFWTARIETAISRNVTS
jgi:hypothetical protein